MAVPCSNIHKGTYNRIVDPAAKEFHAQIQPARASELTHADWMSSMVCLHVGLARWNEYNISQFAMWHA